MRCWHPADEEDVKPQRNEQSYRQEPAAPRQHDQQHAQQAQQRQREGTPAAPAVAEVLPAPKQEPVATAATQAAADALGAVPATVAVMPAVTTGAAEGNEGYLATLGHAAPQQQVRTGGRPASYGRCQATAACDSTNYPETWSLCWPCIGFSPSDHGHRTGCVLRRSTLCQKK